MARPPARGGGARRVRPGHPRQPALPCRPSCRSTRPATTGTWRSPIPCAIACSTTTSRRWTRITGATRAEGRRLPVGRVPDRPAPREQPRQPRALGRGRGGGGRASARTSPTLLEQEEEPGLGNGGLGRLAACYMDSLATLDVPAIGYGIRYEFGIFDQAIRDGWQVELHRQVAALRQPVGDRRVRRSSYDVQLRRPHRVVPRRAAAAIACAGCPTAIVKGVAYDTPVPGYRRRRRRTCCGCGRPKPPSRSTSTRSTSATTTAPSTRRSRSETISKVLYPNDEPEAGKRLRLQQQYFFVSCSLQDMIRLHLMRGKPLDEFDACWAVQLNDTHPVHRRRRADAAARRRARDGLGSGLGDHAADVRLHEPHAAGRGAREMAAAAVRRAAAAPPRDHLRDQPAVPRRGPAARIPATTRCVAAPVAHRRDGRAIRAHGATSPSVGSHAINGVAALHTELLKQTVLSDFYAVAPEKFLNVTNGVTPRRWMALSNPGLSALITGHIGDRWIADLEHELGAPRAAGRGRAASSRSGRTSRPRTSARSPP